MSEMTWFCNKCGKQVDSYPNAHNCCTFRFGSFEHQREYEHLKQENLRLWGWLSFQDELEVLRKENALLTELKNKQLYRVS